jgi:hypothetical protein
MSLLPLMSACSKTETHVLQLRMHAPLDKELTAQLRALDSSFVRTH